MVGYWSYACCTSCWIRLKEQEYVVNNKLDPQAFILAQNITSLLNQFSHGKINSFVESATWADDVKEYKLSLLDVWHYINVPVRLDVPDPLPHINKNDYDCIALVVIKIKILENCYEGFNKLD